MLMDIVLNMTTKTSNSIKDLLDLEFHIVHKLYVDLNTPNS